MAITNLLKKSMTVLSAALALAACATPPLPTAPPTLVAAETPSLPTPMDNGLGWIQGHAWRDVCIAEQGGRTAADLANCVPNPDGSYHADGRIQAGEPRLSGVRVLLGAGPCPASGFAETVTGVDGGYAFGSLVPGVYCVSVDPTTGPTETVGINGGEASPLLETPAFTVSVRGGETQGDVNFGWDFQFVAPPATTIGTCDYKATFIEDVSIPDRATVAPGAVFVKTWRVRNDGTCSWGPDYVVNSLVPTGGDSLNADAGSTSLRATINPGDTADLSVTFTAPTKPGHYVSEWRLSAGEMGVFGVGPHDAPLTVNILVGP